MGKRVSVTFEFDVLPEEIVLLRISNDYRKTEPFTVTDWATEIAECIRAQWDGFGEGHIYGSTISVDVKEN